MRGKWLAFELRILSKSSGHQFVHQWATARVYYMYILTYHTYNYPKSTIKICMFDSKTMWYLPSLTIVFLRMNSYINVIRSRVQCSFRLVAKKIKVNIKKSKHISFIKWRKNYKNCVSYTYGRTHQFHQGTKSFRLYPYPICIECIALKLNLSVIFIF